MSGGNELAVGRELDTLVAEKVMGCVLSTEYPAWHERADIRVDLLIATILRIPVCVTAAHPCANRHGVSRYSTDIAAAWEVVEKLNLLWIDRMDGVYFAAFWAGPENGGHVAQKSADTAPLAICRAALAAVSA